MINSTRPNNYAEHGLRQHVSSFCKTTFHEDTEIIRLVKGEGEIYIDGEHYLLKEGDLYIIRPFVLHTVKNIGAEPLVVDYTKINLRKLSEGCPQTHNIGDFLHFFNEKNVPCVITCDEDWRETVLTCVDRLFNENTDRDNAQLLAYEMLKLLHEHRRPTVSANITTEKQKYAVQTALEYVSSNYKDTISVKDVATLTKYDEYYIMKLFKRFCGWSIIDYVNGIRILTAKKLLIETNNDICAIARQVGYANISYFNRQFKKTYGITPREYRASKN